MGNCWMRKCIGGIALAALAGPGFCEGMHGDLLKRVLAESAKGNCPGSMMSAMLKGQCEQQMPNMGKALASKGPLVDVELVGNQNTPMGQAEVYKVKFASGSMMWMINTDGDGKILVLWSPG